MGSLVSAGLGAAALAKRFGSVSGTARALTLTTGAASLISQIYYSVSSGAPLLPGVMGPWRPPQWAGGPALTVSVEDPNTRVKTVYVFDGIIRAHHEQRSVITLNPVQTGAAISDHAYAIPARLDVEIAMSDAMQSFDVSQWNDGPSRSVSAYQTLVALQKNRTVVQVATRLRQYDQMLVSDVRAEETKETAFALKARVCFTEIIRASVEVTSSSIKWDVADSALPQVTGQTVGGQAQVSPVPASVQGQNATAKLTGSGPLAAVKRSISGAGNWSSVSAGILGSVLR